MYMFKFYSLKSSHPLLLPLSTKVCSLWEMINNLPTMMKTWVWSLGWEDPLEKGTATHFSILTWRIPRTIQSMGSPGVGHKWANFTFTPTIIWSTFWDVSHEMNTIPSNLVVPLFIFKELTHFTESHALLVTLGLLCPISLISVFTYEFA